MSKSGQIHLKTSVILNVPTRVFENDFIFDVNGKSFKTSRIIADLISPKVCKLHLTDPTATSISISTKHRGDFSRILQLSGFKSVDYPSSESDFILEALEALEATISEIGFDQCDTEITIDNAFPFDLGNDQPNIIKKMRNSKRVEFISSHFDELCESKEEELKILDIDTLYEILNSDNLQLNSEDQLVRFINKLYGQDFKYSILYDVVLFQNVSKEVMREFLSVFDVNDISNMTWNRLSERLSQDIKNDPKDNRSDELKIRYAGRSKGGILFEYNKDEDNALNGIIQYLQKETENNIEKEVNITASSNYGDGQYDAYVPKNTTLFNDRTKYFHSQNTYNSWLCYEFKNHEVIPTHYIIRAINNGTSYIPKKWVIEGSNDQRKWEFIDKVDNNTQLVGQTVIYTFEINNNNNKQFKSIRLKATGTNAMNNNYLVIDSFELFGKLI